MGDGARRQRHLPVVAAGGRARQATLCDPLEQGRAHPLAGTCTPPPESCSVVLIFYIASGNDLVALLG